MNNNYRAEIDGLRAISIVAVIMFHFFPNVVKGGFIGVDVFFVISGYLITRIISSSFDKEFSFLSFYCKRIKRIFPALIFVIAASIIAGFFLLFSSEYMLLGKHVAANSSFFLNFVLWNESGYFDKSSDLKPLLHLWSLAVEEQFYFIWPLILFLSFKKSINRVFIIILIIIISFYINLQLTKYSSIASFYLPFSRIWELASGGLLSQLTMIQSSRWHNIEKKLDSVLNNIIYTDRAIKCGLFRNLISFIGLLTIVLCAVFFKKLNSFPGKYALIPVLSTSLIIFAGSDTWVSKNILSNRVFVWLGKISYPLYLWHWPLLSFVTIIESQNVGLYLKLALIFISLILAQFTYIFIEKPIRFSKSLKMPAIILLAIYFSLGALGYMIYQNGGYIFEITNINSKLHINSKLLGKPLYGSKKYINTKLKKCSDFPSLADDNTPFCYSKSANPEIAIIGDSSATAMGYGTIIDENLNAMVLSYSAALPFSNHTLYSSFHNKREEVKRFKKLRARTIDAAKMDSVKYVIFSARGPFYIYGKGVDRELTYNNPNYFFGANDNNLPVDVKEKMIEEYVSIIKLIHSLGKKVIFVTNVPELDFDASQCIERIKITNSSAKKCTLERKDVDKRNAEYIDLVQQIKLQAPSLLVYNPTDLFCDKEKCYAYRGKKLTYEDDCHLNDYGAKILAKGLVDFLNKNAATNKIKE